MDPALYNEYYKNEIIVLVILTILFLLPNISRKYFFFNNAQPEAAATGNRIKFFDFAKGLSIIAVIIIHVSDSLLRSKLFPDSSAFLLESNNFSRFAIPVFLICAGALVRPIRDYGGFAKFLFKKFQTVFLPYILTSLLLGALVGVSTATISLAILRGHASLPYYFVLVLFQLYLITPWLERYKQSRAFLPFCFLISFASFLWPRSWHLAEISSFFIYLFFFAFGLKAKQRLFDNTFTQKPLIPGLTIAAYVILLQIFPSFVYNARLIFGVAVFYLLLYIYNRLPANFFSTFLELVGRHSLWIFLFHFPILTYILSATISAERNFFSFYLFLFLACFTLSLLLSMVMKKVYEWILSKFLLYS